MEVEEAIGFLQENQKILEKGLCKDGFSAEVFFATTNYGKIDEFKGFLSAFKSLNDIVSFCIKFGILKEVLDVEETARTFYGNSILKSSQNADFLAAQNGEFDGSIFVMSEDSGLVVPAVGFKPGVFSARFFKMNLPSFPDNFFSKAIEYANKTLMADESLSLSKREKNTVDYLNNVMLAQMILDSGNAGKRLPASFTTVASIVEGGVRNSFSTGYGNLEGEVFIPKEFNCNDEEFLKNYARDFGYNSLFFTLDGRCLADVDVNERTQWNSRSLAVARALMHFLVNTIVKYKA